jgi:hypothetical protein
MGRLKRNCFHGAVCESGFCRHGLCQGAVPKMPGYSCSAPIWRYLCGFVDTFVMWGCFHPMCQEKCDGVFTAFSGGARVRTSLPFVCRPCLASVCVISHGRHGIFGKTFLRFFGGGIFVCFCGGLVFGGGCGV